MIASALTTLVGILVFIFIFWKKQKEDYSSEIIFKSAFTIIFGIIAFSIVGMNFAPNAFLWLELVGAATGVTLSVNQYKIRFYESLDAMVIAIMPWLALLFLKDSVVNSSLSSFIAFIIILFLIFVYYFFDQHYKDFGWYKSGKIGFAGLMTLGIFFLIRSAIASFGITVLSFVSRFEAVVSGVFAFVCFLLVVNLARQKT